MAADHEVDPATSAARVDDREMPRRVLRHLRDKTSGTAADREGSSRRVLDDHQRPRDPVELADGRPNLLGCRAGLRSIVALQEHQAPTRAESPATAEPRGTGCKATDTNVRGSLSQSDLAHELVIVPEEPFVI